MLFPEEVSNTFLYFAYGSNMLTKRLLDRVSSAHPIATASLTGHRLTFHKPSDDGSGKCTIERTDSANDVVWGVLFEIEKGQERILDGFEGKGYSASFIEVSDFTGVKTYVANRVKATLVPYHWYKDLVVAGAIQHGLPEEYITQLCAVASKDDPDRQRELDAREILNANPPMRLA
jgi:gamma-glutamylcyclotransferase